MQWYPKATPRLKSSRASKPGWGEAAQRRPERSWWGFVLEAEGEEGLRGQHDVACGPCVCVGDAETVWS